ncbi:MAG: protein kinase [candidate division Zixibacteria bacterium]|nr:protein kinase [candidate division Zixibacteria bacterium]
MIGQTVSHFKILEKIGEGGMGVVYRAQDVHLDRPVALKFLPRGLAANLPERERFIHEAKAASALNHSNITTVYEIGEYDGQLFIAMELVEGKTLKQLAGEESPPLERILDVGIQLAEALSAAHEREIVHRDIKGDNIMLTSKSQIKIMDFGLAKLKGASKLTKTGSTIGTVGYMSPEQAQGKEVDRRTDIFSFGVVLYELITGKLPFSGEHQTAVIYAICNDEPEPLSRFRGGVPESLQRIIDKVLTKDVDERYQNISDLQVDLRRTKKELVSGVKEGVKSDKKAVAVLYFENLSPDPDSDYFAAGITEDIITDISKIENIRVASRNAVLPYKGKPVDIPQLGKKMNVDAILEGSIRKAGNRLRITAQLIDTKEGFHLWAERYDREATEVFELQEEIAKSIAAALKVKLSPREEKQLGQKYKGDLQAYEYYLKGRNHYVKYTKADMLAAMQMFQKALEIDPNYALAYAGLGDSYFQMLDKHFDSDNSWLVKSEEASRKALSIDPFCKEAYKALANVLAWQRKFQSSIRALERALEIDPNFVPAHINLSIAYAAFGDFKEAERRLSLAWQKDPSVPFSLFLLAVLHLKLGHYDQALLVANQLLKAAGSTFYIRVGYQILSDIYLYRRDYDQALQHLQKALELDATDAYGRAALAIIYAAQGKRGEALEKAKGVQIDKILNEYVLQKMAELYALLDDREEVYRWARKSIEVSPVDWWGLEHNPLLEKYRQEPEFQQLLAEAKEKILNSE